MGRYFKDIWTGVYTVILGMKVTFMHLFEKSVTVQYPKVEKREQFPLARGKLVNRVEECACCYKCQRICPVEIFEIKGIRADKDEDLGMLPDGKPKKMHVIQFDIDFSKCVYCGLCVDVCDTKSLHWEGEVETVTSTREEMKLSFANLPEDEVKRLLEKEAAKKAARAAAGGPPGAKKPGARPAPKPKPKADTGEAKVVKESGPGKAEVESKPDTETGPKAKVEEKPVTESPSDEAKVENKSPEKSDSESNDSESEKTE